MKQNYKSIPVLMYLLLITQVVISQSIPSEMYFLHNLRTGEKLKALAAYYHINFESILGANKELASKGYKEGEMIRIPMEDMVAIDVVYKINGVSEPQNINLYSASLNEYNRFESIWVNEAEIRSVMNNYYKPNMEYSLEIKFRDKEKRKIVNKDEIQNIVGDLMRIESSRREINYAFNKFQYYK